MASEAEIQLPIIDISSATAEVGKQVIDAARQYGFLYIDTASSCFSKEEIDSTFKMAQEFFASPIEEKKEVEIRAINFGEFKNNKANQPLPKSLVPHEDNLNRFTSLCQKTCARILTLLALGLDIPDNWFSSRHDPSHGPSGSTLRFLYYPSLRCPSTQSFQHGVDVRAGAHSDYGSITLLFQRDGQPGLEILTLAGTWAGVPVRPAGVSTSASLAPPILVNIGDLLSYWTRGVLKSTVHRVVFAKGEEEESEGRDRYSIVYFCHPCHDTELVAVPSNIVEEVGKGKDTGEGTEMVGEKVVTAGEHLASRLAATYGRSVGAYHRD
ncbi:oxidoreductase [Trichophyton rubrum]|uniref:Oxidoreductase n=1 Tax=Trichophyton rubrum TaxID=5551 RepID=A0A178F7A2_TRIRU|nr:oxidoreductase [Trichophyton rubrum]